MLNSVNHLNYSDNRAEFYEQLRLREREWLQARERLITLKEKQIFWFGDTSLIMWLLWQLISYVVVAILLMLANKFLQVHLTLGQCMIIFAVQTLLFIILFTLKGQLAERLQNSIDKEDLVREQALSEMNILAENSIFPDIHAHSPLSLKDIYERYETQLHIASLQHLLQQEVDAGRLILGHHQAGTKVLPPEFADNDLISHASQMIYKSLVQTS